MTLLDAHLKQISLCAASITNLSFAAPEVFTNALLQSHDITSLIRDTELHERALFSVPPASPPAPSEHADAATAANRRNTLFNLGRGGSATSRGGTDVVRAPRRNTAVAAVLGTELVERIRRGGGGGAGSGLGYRTYNGNKRNEVDVESLLEGAEKLLGVYPIPGVHEKIAAMRQRYIQVVASIDYHEGRLAEQQTRLSRLNRSRDLIDEDINVVESEPQPAILLTEEDLQREEEETRQLERKKRELEDRVHSMSRDISALQ